MIILFYETFRPVLGPTHPPVQRVLGALSPGAKRSGHEADTLPPSRAEFENECNYRPTYTHPNAFRSWVGKPLHLLLSVFPGKYSVKNGVFLPHSSEIFLR